MGFSHGLLPNTKWTITPTWWRAVAWIWPTDVGNQFKQFSPKWKIPARFPQPGFEPGTLRIRSENSNPGILTTAPRSPLNFTSSLACWQLGSNIWLFMQLGLTMSCNRIMLLVNHHYMSDPQFLPAPPPSSASSPTHSHPTLLQRIFCIIL